MSATPSLRRENAAPVERSRHRAAIVLFVAVLFCYLGNARNVASDDTVPARFLPFSILTRGTLYLDGYVDYYARPYQSGEMGYGPYFIMPSRGHQMSSYPLTTPVLLLPFYVVPAWWAHHRGWAPGSPSLIFLALAMDKLLAAMMTALGTVIFYWAMRRLLPDRAALWLALIYGLASPVWIVSSQALWLETLTDLSFCLLIWALVSDDGSRKYAFWAGIALALACANKATNGATALPVIAWFAVRTWRTAAADRTRRLATFFAPLAAIGSLIVAYNLYYFHNVFGAYVAGFRTLGYSGVSSGFSGHFFEGVAGLLVSPNRGLFIFVPWTILAMWGAVRLWRTRPFGWEPWLIAGAVLNVLPYAKLERWYGGYTFGPRYMVDIMPIIALCLVPVFQAASRWNLARTALVVTASLALGVQVLGALCYPNGGWNEHPVSVDVAPARVWDWHDLQLVRTLRAGPEHTKILDHLRGVHSHYEPKK